MVLFFLLLPKQIIVVKGVCVIIQHSEDWLSVLRTFQGVLFLLLYGSAKWSLFCPLLAI